MKKQNASLLKVVQALSDGAYHDGTTIGSRLGITRSAVWKTIERLKEYGVAIDSVKGKGYALTEPLTLLHARTIKAHCELAKDVAIDVFESMPSTNDYLRTLPQKKSIRVCLAEQQTQGKGRLGRQWYSPFGLNLYFSCLYRFEKDVSELAGLSLVVGLAVAKTLNEFIAGSEKAKVKWPNDVFFADEKIAGSLIEVQAETHGACYAVIGVGVNVNMLQGSPVITQAYTSLRKITGEIIDRNKLCARLLTHLLTCLERFAQSGLPSFLAEWTELDLLRGRRVNLQRLDGVLSGVVVGVNSQGHLVMRMEDGSERGVSAGDVSVCK